jgi:hypothetical protein
MLKGGSMQFCEMKEFVISFNHKLEIEPFGLFLRRVADPNPSTRDGGLD